MLPESALDQVASEVAYGSGLSRWNSGGGSLTSQMATWTHQWDDGPWGAVVVQPVAGDALTGLMSLVQEVQKKWSREGLWNWVAVVENRLPSENGKRQSRIQQPAT